MQWEEENKHSNSNFIKHNLLCTLFQVHSFLCMYQNVYMHYDVHFFNLLIIKVPVYTLLFHYIHMDADCELLFHCNYPVKLIDYGCLYIKNVMECFIKSLCGQFKDCGKFEGYYNFTNDKNIEQNFNISYVNRSTDMRLLNMVKNKCPLV